MKRFYFIFIAFSLLLFASCTENYSKGERVGMVTQFSRTGLTDACESWEGHLNLTQTGMNSSVAWDFSIDNDREDPDVIATIDSAAQLGWKVKLVYHETCGKNWFSNRGETDHFVTKCTVLDKDVIGNAFNGNKDKLGASKSTNNVSGKVIDTIYVVIDKSQLKHK